MYYPKQIPHLLDVEFHSHLIYEEYHPAALADVCMCIWRIVSHHPLNETIYNYILPDACIDLVIDFTKHTICFAGYSKETEAFELHKDIDYMGVRFKPGAFYALYHVDAYHIMDRMAAFSDIDLSSSLDDIFSFYSVQERIARLQAYVTERFSKFQPNDFMKIVEQLYAHPSDHSVLEIATSMGYDQRHLMRLFQQYIGVTPKVLLNILRLHLCLTLLLDEHKTLMEAVSICGFYDQSHFIKETKRYTNVSPIQLLKKLEV